MGVWRDGGEVHVGALHLPAFCIPEVEVEEEDKLSSHTSLIKTIGLETVLLSLLPIYLHGIYLQQIYTFSKIGSFSNTIILVFSFTGFSGFFVSTAGV